MPTTLYTVDSFTNVPFAGNPAAVCVLDSPRDMVGMQCSARGGIVKTALQGDRVLLCGQAETMMKAELLV